MRTTLVLDDEVHCAARELARQQGVTIGRVISKLVRQSLAAMAALEERNGFPLFKPTGLASRPNLRMVNRLRDEV